ncbi:hypothetical protein BGX28_008720 [Mortierella sp. GBA30]|nr:hypothetical protein BGX28_008720 [Mortierella sp. GBA30]
MQHNSAVLSHEDVPGTVAPSLEPNISSPRERVKDGDNITLDILLNGIQRLAAHEFGSASKQAPYPAVLEPLHQRLFDYHVCLKSARKKIATHTRNCSDEHIRTLSHVPETSYGALGHSVSFGMISKDMSTGVIGNIAIDPSDVTEKTTHLLNARISDLEHQLAQSRQAHHTLLKEHILNLDSTAYSSPFPGPTAITAKISATDAKVMEQVLATVASSAKSMAAASLLGSMRRPDFGSFCTSSIDMKSTRPKSPVKELRMEQGQRQESIPCRQEATDNRAQASLLITAQSPTTSEPDLSLATVDNQTLMSDATTRLLCAETELGMLMLVMAQNAEEISGLEEEVSRKQKELTHHRKLFESLLESIPLGFQTQIDRYQQEVKDLETQVTTLEADKKEAEKRIRDLEAELHELNAHLAEKREEQDKREGQQTERIKELEAVTEQLREELRFQVFKVQELTELAMQAEQASQMNKQELEETTRKFKSALEQNAEEGQHMLDHLEKHHKKRTADLHACLVKAQKANKRLNKELSSLAVKIVRVEALNDILSDQAEKDRESILTLKQEASMLMEQMNSGFNYQSSWTPCSAENAEIVDNESRTIMKEKITALEIQIDELTSSLRVKEIELEQAHGEAARLALQLEQDLASQQQVHQEEMQKFSEEKKTQAQRERACQTASVTLFQNMVTKLQNELTDTQEKLRDTTLCWGHTKEQLQKCEQSYRRRKKDLEVTSRNLHEVEETVAKLGDAIGMLEMEKEANMVLIRTLEERDRELRDMEYRLRVLEEEHD